MLIIFAMTLTDESCYGVIDTSQNVIMECRKTLRVNQDKKNEYKHTYHILCVMRMTQNEKSQ